MIPLARPWLDEHELDAVAEVLRSGMLVQGAVVARFEAALAERCERRFAVAVSNGTSALGLTYRALGVRPGDTIAVPALTWPSPAHAALELGLQVRLADVDAETWNVSAATLAELGDATLGDATRGDATVGDVKLVVAVDQFGNPLPDDLARSLEVPLVEDAACAIGSVLRGGRPCGSLGVASCLSFHPRKLVTTGEGGAVLTDDEGLAETLRALRNHGQSTPGTFVCASGNHRLGELQAALGLAQLAKLDAMIARRREHAEVMREGIRRGCGERLRFQRELEGARGNVQTLGAVLADGLDRERFFEGMRGREVQAGILSYDLGAIGTVPGAAPTPNASETVARGIALPLYPQMSEDERARVIEATCAAVEEAEKA